MIRPIAVGLLAGVLFGVSGSTLRAEITAQQVREAIDRGVTYLKEQQRRTDPPWGDYGIVPGGVTGLCEYGNCPGAIFGGGTEST